jgi:hypothetical protein
MIDLRKIDVVIFDFGLTLCSQKYFTNDFIEYPEIYKIYQEMVFHDSDVLSKWETGKLSYFEIAGIISRETNIDIKKIIKHMEDGCKNLPFNKEVYDFAVEMKECGKKIFLVTVNMDIFTSVVIPNHQELNIFDSIVNSSDHQNDDKNILWRLVIDSEKYHFDTALLIEDGLHNIVKFQDNGGIACQYINEAQFRQWKKEIKT